MMVTLPYVHQQLGARQLVPLGLVLCTLYQLDVIRTRPSLFSGLLLGLYLSLQYYVCSYYALFLIILLPITAIPLLGYRIASRRSWNALLISLVPVLVIAFPIVLAQSQYLSSFGFKRDASDFWKGSALPSDYLLSTWKPLVPFPGIGAAGSPSAIAAFFPGTIKGALAVAGLVFGLSGHGRRRWVVAVTCMILVAGLMSVGPRIRWGQVSIQDIVAHLVPGMAHVRTLFRFGVFVQLGTVILATFGLHYVTVLDRTLRHRSGYKVAARSKIAASLILVAGTLGVCEILPPRQPLFTVPPLEPFPQWTIWLRDNTPPGTVLACVPFSKGVTVRGYVDDAMWMYWQAAHGRRIANGYSGYFPEPFLAVQREMKRFPAPESVDELRRIGVEWCVVQQGLGAPSRSHLARAGLTEIYYDEISRVSIFQIPKAKSTPGSL
ncbi:MAG: hypothetical protein IT366_18925 [Candidatus Hydrogenedentes bacterium]|nr:hypothetical protein [Candidatus Hydrogenedentota bacterium]